MFPSVSAFLTLSNVTVEKLMKIWGKLRETNKLWWNALGLAVAGASCLIRGLANPSSPGPGEETRGSSCCHMEGACSCRRGLLAGAVALAGDCNHHPPKAPQGRSLERFYQHLSLFALQSLARDGHWPE